jgi:hypothetical protein
MPAASALASNAPPLSALLVAPFLVGETATFNIIGCEVTAFATAGGVVRLGIYADNGHGRPGALVLDAGTVISTTPNQNREIIISKQLTAGIYWLALDSQVVVASFRAMNPNIPPINVGTVGIAPVNAHSNAYYKSSVTGAFPDPYGTPSGIAATCARVYLRCNSVP